MPLLPNAVLFWWTFDVFVVFELEFFLERLTISVCVWYFKPPQTLSVVCKNQPPTFLLIFLSSRYKTYSRDCHIYCMQFVRIFFVVGRRVHCVLVPSHLRWEPFFASGDLTSGCVIWPLNLFYGFPLYPGHLRFLSYRMSYFFLSFGRLFFNAFLGLSFFFS